MTEGISASVASIASDIDSATDDVLSSCAIEILSAIDIVISGGVDCKFEGNLAGEEARLCLFGLDFSFAFAAFGRVF
jgi:hypothetical protein